MKSFITLLLVTICIKSFAFTYTWTGATNTNWNTASNWAGGPINTYPTVNDDVIINGTATTPIPNTNPGLFVGTGGIYSCKSMQINNINLPTAAWAFTINNNNVSIQNCTVFSLNIAATLIANGNTTLTLSNIIVNNVSPLGFFQITSYLHGANSTINTTISGCTLKGTNITNNSNNGISNSNITINNNTTIKGSITTSGLNANTQVINSKIENLFDGTNRSTATIQVTEKGSLIVQNTICNNANFYTTNTGSGLSILNSYLNYDSSCSVNSSIVNLGDSSNINWTNTDINVNANFYNGITGSGNGLRISMGKRQTLNGNINLTYTNNNGIFLFDEFQAKSDGGSKLSKNNFVDPPTINGNINIGGGSIGFTSNNFGQVFKVNGSINHTGTNIDGLTSIRTLSVPGPNSFTYGGYYLLEDPNQSFSISASDKSTLILGGNTNTFIKWPTNFYMDQLVIDKQNGASVTIDSSLVIGSDLKILNGILKLPANQNLYKLVVFDSLIINNGAALICSDNGANAANILMQNDFGTTYSTNTAVIDSNATISATTGLNLTPNTKIVFGRGNAMGLANSTNPINIDFLSTANATQNFYLFNNLNINGLNYTNKPRFFLNNSNLTVQTPITGFSSTQFIITNGTGKLRMPVGTTPVVFPLGLRPQDGNGLNYNPATITNTGTLDFFGVSVKDSVYSNATTGTTITNNIVRKTWFLDEAIAGGSNVTLSLSWNSTNQSLGFNSSSCYVSHYNSNAWDVATASAATGSGLLSKSRSGITSFSPFTVTSSSTPLSVKWIQFTGNKTEAQKAVLNWQVQEYDVQEYIVQKAIDNINFSNLETIASKGNGYHTYTFNDVYSLNETSHYRIMQIDNDGKYSYSKVVAIMTTVKSETLKLFPNPVKNNLFVQVTSTKAQNATLQITDMQGKVLQQQQVQLPIGNTSNSINTSPLAKGSYLLIIKGEALQQQQFIKQ